MAFDIQSQPPIFSNNINNDTMNKSILFYDELDNYERKIRIIQNEFAGALKQEQAAELLAWIGGNMRK